MLRTIKESLAVIKEMDPETAVTEYFIRTLANSGEIKVRSSGKKLLINVSSLKEYLGM